MYKQGNHVNNVSNLDAFEIRSYCKLIEEEHTMSSRPLIDHICAICGGLLQPGFGCYSSIEQTGRAGIPSQVRGQRCAWDALPPFMLLFSKRLLARRLPSIFEITEDERLLLKTSATQLPWLHYKSRRVADKTAPTGRS